MSKEQYQQIITLDPDFRKKVWETCLLINRLSQVYGFEKLVDFKFKEYDDLSVNDQKDAISFLINIREIGILSSQEEPPAGCVKVSGISFRDLNFATIVVFDEFKDFFGELSKEYTREKVSGLKYSNGKSVLSLNEYKIPFKRYSNSEALLDTLINAEDEYYKLGQALDFETVNAFIKQRDIFSTIEDFYAVKKVINDKIAKVTNIKDFIILKDKMVSINPLYI